MPTTPRGIVYPDSDANTNLWEHFEALADSVDFAIGGDEDAGLVSAWTNMSLTPAAGWTITSARYRVLLGVFVCFDAVFTRVGGPIVATNVGNMPDTLVATGVPSAIRPAAVRYLDFMRSTVAAGRISVSSTGTVEAVTLEGGATLESTITVHDFYMLG